MQLPILMHHSSVPRRILLDFVRRKQLPTVRQYSKMPVCNISSLSSAAAVDAALDSWFDKPVPWRGVAGTVHVCAMHPESSTSNNALLRNIKINDFGPKCEHDFFFLNIVRALTSCAIQSGANLRFEGGFPVALCPPFDEGLSAWRAQIESQRGAAGSSSGAGAAATPEPPSTGCAAIITWGQNIDPKWPIFSEPSQMFPPIIFTTAEAAASLRTTFAAATGCPPVRTAPGDLDSLSMRSVHGYLRKRYGDKAIISVECGPTTTRPMYVQGAEAVGVVGATCDTPSAAASAANSVQLHPELDSGHPRRPAILATDPLTWKPHAPAECMVDWLFLSTYEGPLHPDAAGDVLMTQQIVDATFDLIATATAEGDDNPNISGWIEEQRASAAAETVADADKPVQQMQRYDPAKHPNGLWTFRVYRNKKHSSSGSSSLALRDLQSKSTSTSS